MSDMAPERRGLLLLTLAEQYPLPLTQAALMRPLRMLYAGSGGGALFERDAALLAELGLIESEESEVMGRHLRTLTLTAQGVLVAEGSVAQPGVQV